MAKDKGNGPEDKTNKEDKDGDNSGNPPEQKKTEDQDNEHGFPKDTPLEEMTEAQRTAYWKHKARKHENAVKAMPKDYEEQKALADKWREHEEKQKSPDQVKQEADAKALREQVRKELLAENAPTLVEAAFKAQIGNRLEESKLALLLEDLDHTKYLDADGKVDIERVKTRAEILAPASDAKPNPRQRTHQGHRQSSGDSGMSAGRAAYEARHGKKKN